MSSHRQIPTVPVASGLIEVPADYGDVRHEFEALSAGCGVYRMDFRTKVIITGKDRVRWLNGMVTNNIRDLAAGHGVYTFLLNAQGHILGEMYAFNRGDHLLLDIDQTQVEKLIAAFEHYIIMDDVELTKVSEKLIGLGIVGPEATKVLTSAGFEAPELKPLQLADQVWHNIGVTLMRREEETGGGYEAWLAPENIVQMWNALVAAEATRVGSAALELYRIARGIPRYGQDIRERDLPQETEQARALHFTKGCYIGQEIVERIRSRGAVHRKFTGFLVEGPLPAVGSKLQSEGKDVGEITSVAELPSTKGERRVALGYLRREVSTPNKTLEAAGSKLTVSAIPVPVD